MGLVGYTVSNLENGLWYGISPPHTCINPQTKGCPQRTAYEFKLFNRLFCDIFAVSFLDDVPVEFESGHVLCKNGFGSILVVCRDRISNSLVI